MAVIMTSEVAGQTLHGYDGLFNAVSPHCKAHRGSSCTPLTPWTGVGE
jgi:hypothetical protein